MDAAGGSAASASSTSPAARHPLHNSAALKPPAGSTESTLEFYCLDKDKEDVEVVAAGKLNDAVEKCVEELSRSKPELCHLAAILSPLNSNEFSNSDRGNARRLCASVRRFAEATLAIVKEDSAVGRACKEVRKVTRWSLHPPLTRSRLEMTAHSHRIKYKQETIKGDDVRRAAELLRSIVSALVDHGTASLLQTGSGRTSSLASAGWRKTSESSELLEPTQALDATIATAKDGFQARRQTHAVGKHGEWRLEDTACTLQRHALLLFEAEEHLVDSSHGFYQRSGTTPTLEELCIGLRMFAEKGLQAMYGMRTDQVSECIFRRCKDMKGAVQWAAHADTFFRRDAGVCLTIDAAYLTATLGTFNALVHSCFTVLDYFAEEPRASVLGLAKASHTDWRAALYLGLCLKDKAKCEKDGKETYKEGCVRYSYSRDVGPCDLMDSAVLLQRAERLLSEALQGSPSLRDAHIVATKELYYVLLDLVKGKRQPEGFQDAGVFARVEAKKAQYEKEGLRASAEASMKSLGDMLLGEGTRPPTAKEQLALQLPAAVA